MWQCVTRTPSGRRRWGAAARGSASPPASSLWPPSSSTCPRWEQVSQHFFFSTIGSQPSKTINVVQGATDTLYTVAVHSFNKNAGLYRQKTITISFYLVIGHSNIPKYFLHNTVHFFLFSLRQRLIVEFPNFLAVYKIKGSKGAKMYPTFLLFSLVPG